MKRRSRTTAEPEPRQPAPRSRPAKPARRPARSVPAARPRRSRLAADRHPHRNTAGNRQKPLALRPAKTASAAGRGGTDMTDARKTPEDQVLQHFREQHSANRRRISTRSSWPPHSREVPAPKPSLWQRWVQACQKPRWQVAFASLVGVALMLALVQRTPEQAPSYDFAPAPKASAPVAKKEAAQAARSLAAPAGAMSAPAPAAPMADFAAPAQSESISAEMADEAKVSKRPARRRQSPRRAIAGSDAPAKGGSDSSRR